MGRGLLVLWVALWSGGCLVGAQIGTPDPLRGSGTRTTVDAGFVQRRARKLAAEREKWKASQATLPSGDYAKAAEDILTEAFGKDARNPDLPDILAYLPRSGEPTVVLMQSRKAVRVLDREPAVWVVAFVETNADESCPNLTIRMTGIGRTRPDIALSPDALFGSLLLGDEQKLAASDPRTDFAITEEVGTLENGGRLCMRMHRFALLPDSVNRLSISSSPDRRPDGGAAKVAPCTFFPFANARQPLYGGSVAVGSSLLNLKTNDWCVRHGRCTPSLYVFGFITLFQSPWPWSWWAISNWSASLALGVRLLDPALGEAAAGLRFGLGRGWSTGLARFGLIAGVSYPFRTSDHTTDTVSTAVTHPDGTVETITRQVSPEANQWHLFGAVDFAF